MSSLSMVSYRTTYRTMAVSESERGLGVTGGSGDLDDEEVR